MAFKRMEGFVGSVPQRFIDNHVVKCPMCGTTEPHWAIDQKMQMKLEGNLYLFQCEQCGCVLSAPVPDVTGLNNTALTTTGLIKRLGGKKNGVIYMKVQDVGRVQTTKVYEGKEMTLQELNQMALELG